MEEENIKRLQGNEADFEIAHFVPKLTLMQETEWDHLRLQV